MFVLAYRQHLINVYDDNNDKDKEKKDVEVEDKDGVNDIDDTVTFYCMNESWISFANLNQAHMCKLESISNYCVTATSETGV